MNNSFRGAGIGYPVVWWMSPLVDASRAMPSHTAPPGSGSHAGRRVHAGTGARCLRGVIGAEVRRVLEPAVCARAAALATEEDIERLESILGSSTASSPVDDLVNADLEFHRKIA